MAKISYLEAYTKAYIKGHGVKSLPKKSLKRALVLVSEKLDSSCCDDPTASVDLVTKRNSNFLRGFEDMLRLIPRQGNIASLTRIKNLLQSIVDGDCCL